MNSLHPVDPGIPEGPDLTLVLHLTQEESDPGLDTEGIHQRDHGRDLMTHVGPIGDILVPEKGDAARVDLIPGAEGRTKTVKEGRTMTGMKRGCGTKQEDRLQNAMLVPDGPAVQAEAREKKRGRKDGTVAGKELRAQHSEEKAGILNIKQNPPREKGSMNRWNTSMTVKWTARAQWLAMTDLLQLISMAATGVLTPRRTISLQLSDHRLPVMPRTVYHTVTTDTPFKVLLLCSLCDCRFLKTFSAAVNMLLSYDIHMDENVKIFFCQKEVVY